MFVRLLYIKYHSILSIFFTSFYNDFLSRTQVIKLPQSNNRQNFLKTYKGVEGFPVKIEQNVSQMGVSFSMIIVLNELKEVAVAENEFKVPSEFKVQEGFPSFGGFGK